MKRFNFWSLLLFIPFVLGLYVALFEEKFYVLEKTVFLAFRKLAPTCDIAFTLLTELGSAVGVITITSIIFIISLFFKKRFFDFGMPIAITAIVSRVINITLKNIIDRPRPDFRILSASEASFPSGHAMNNMALYISVLLAALLIVSAPKWRTVLKITMIAMPVIIGITRIYFGVHYVSDVFAGWALGALVAIVVNLVYFKILSKVKEKRNV